MEELRQEVAIVTKMVQLWHVPPTKGNGGFKDSQNHLKIPVVIQSERPCPARFNYK